LIIDSHKNKHGTNDVFGVISYITRYDLYKGLIQYGYKK